MHYLPHHFLWTVGLHLAQRFLHEVPVGDSPSNIQYQEWVVDTFVTCIVQQKVPMVQLFRTSVGTWHLSYILVCLMKNLKTHKFITKFIKYVNGSHPEPAQQSSQLHIFSSKIHFNFIFPSMSLPPKWSFL